MDKEDTQATIDRLYEIIEKLRLEVNPVTAQRCQFQGPQGCKGYHLASYKIVADGKEFFFCEQDAYLSIKGASRPDRPINIFKVNE